MPNMLEIDAEYHAASDQVRLRYLKKLHDVTKRNIIIYYSGWLKKNQRLQDAVLSVHHACSLTLMRTSTSKLIMNHEGINVAQKID